MPQALLQPAIQGDRHTGQLITWWAGNAVKDLTGAVLTGTLKNAAGVAIAIAGTLTVIDGAAGTFQWSYGTADTLTAGTYTVQFTATYSGAPDSSFSQEWVVVALQ